MWSVVGDCAIRKYAVPFQHRSRHRRGPVALEGGAKNFIPGQQWNDDAKDGARQHIAT